MADTDKTDLAQLTVQLLSSYLSNNIVPREDLADLIKTTRAALSVEAPASPKPEYVPTVSVRKSLASAEHIISLIDGKPYKMLKRHLAQHGLTPAQYRERYNLPSDYPMTAKAYSEERRATAARIGLGSRKPIAAPTPLPSAAEPVAQPALTASAVVPSPATNLSPATDSKNETAPEALAGPKRRGRKPKALGETATQQTSGVATAKGKKAAPVAKADSPAKSGAAKAPRKAASKKADTPTAAASAIQGDAISKNGTPEAPKKEPAQPARKKAAPNAAAPASEGKRGGRKANEESAQSADQKAEPIAAPAPSAPQSASSSPAKVAKKATAKGGEKSASKPASADHEVAPTADVRDEKKPRKTLKIRTDA